MQTPLVVGNFRHWCQDDITTWNTYRVTLPNMALYYELIRTTVNFTCIVVVCLSYRDHDCLGHRDLRLPESSYRNASALLGVFVRMRFSKGCPPTLPCQPRLYVIWPDRRSFSWVSTWWPWRRGVGLLCQLDQRPWTRFLLMVSFLSRDFCWVLRLGSFSPGYRENILHIGFVGLHLWGPVTGGYDRWSRCGCCTVLGVFICSMAFARLLHSVVVCPDESW